eukprot:TRINITY_DN366_c0_g1_i1.p1 TRINITY_DN366_c0_g1~~TRINITY_DN366_c0_g1_i1.p1  ORF type:complete len:1308 (-),score=337.69 TRINITY_DN366_c0_g1_i1:1274-4711(-)
MATQVPVERLIKLLVAETCAPPLSSKMSISLGFPQQISIERPSASELPLSQYSLWHLMDLIDAETVVQLVGCALLEQKIVFVSSQFSLLTLAAECLRTLMFPFSWPHVYVPIVPCDLLEFVAAPTPFIMGIHRSMLGMLPEAIAPTVIVCDIDEGTLTVPASELHLATQLGLQLCLTSRLQALRRGVLQQADALFPEVQPLAAPPVSLYCTTSYDLAVRRLFVGTFARMMRSWTDFVLYLSNSMDGRNSVVLFNKQSFLRTRPQLKDFLHVFLDTQAFSLFVDYRAAPHNADVFDYLIERCASHSDAHGSSPRSPNRSNTPVPKPQFPGLTAAISPLTPKHSMPRLSPSSFSFPTPASAGDLQPLLLPTPQSVPVDNAPSPLGDADSVASAAHKPYLQVSSDQLPDKPAYRRGASYDTAPSQPLTALQSGSVFESAPVRSPLMDTAEESAHGDAVFSDTREFTVLDQLLVPPPRQMVDTLAVDVSALQNQTMFYEAMPRLSEELFGEPRQVPSFVASPSLLPRARSSSVLLVDGGFGSGVLASPGLSRARVSAAKRKPQHSAAALRTFLVDDVLRTLIHGQPLSAETLLQASEMLAFTNARQLFSQGLLDIARALASDYDLTDESFAALVRLIKAALPRALEADPPDFVSPHQMMTASVQLHYQDQGKRVALKDRILDSPMWQEQEFWAAAFDEELSASTDTHQMDEEQAEAAVFNLIGAFAMRMLSCRVSVLQAKKFIQSQCDDYGLGSAQQHILLVVADNMSRTQYTESSLEQELTAKYHVQRSMGAVSLQLLGSSPKPRSIPLPAVSETSTSCTVLRGHHGAPVCVVSLNVTSPFFSQLATGGADNAIRLWDVQHRKQIAHLKGHTGQVSCMDVQHTKKVLVSGSLDYSLRLWDYSERERIAIMRGHSAPVTGCLFHGPNAVISFSWDCSVRAWDTRVQQCIHQFRHRDKVTCATMGDEYTVISGGFDNAVRVFDLRTGKARLRFRGHTDVIRGVSYCEQMLISSSADGTVRAWDIVSGEAVRTLAAHHAAVTAMAVDGAVVVTGARDGSVRQWNAQSNESTWLDQHAAEVCSVAVQGHYALTGSCDAHVQLHHLPSQTAVSNLTGHTSDITAVALQGQSAVSCSYDGSVRVWDLSDRMTDL